MLQDGRGIFVISLDFELQYGMEDVPGLQSYKKNIAGGRTAVVEILKLFEKYNIHATWAIVGMMLAESKEELIGYAPSQTPSYENGKLSIYNNMNRIGSEETQDPYHYGFSLVKKICEIPAQEIGTHTFSHYYCLEKGQTREEFEADLKSAKRIMKDKLGIDCKSLVLPRNQINSSYIDIIRKLGITSYRGCPKTRIYRTVSKSYFVRGLRLLDTYIKMFGNKCYSKNVYQKDICDIKASCFLRAYCPWLKWMEPIKLLRIKKQMKYAAKRNLVFHMWWHPHNFGRYTEKNLKQLREILDYYLFLNRRYGFQSRNMKELSEEILL